MPRKHGGFKRSAQQAHSVAPTGFRNPSVFRGHSSRLSWMSLRSAQENCADGNRKQNVITFVRLGSASNRPSTKPKAILDEHYKSKNEQLTGHKALLSISEASIFLGITRSTAYRSIKNVTFPLSVIRLGDRLRTSRVALILLLNGEEPTNQMAVEVRSPEDALYLTCRSTSTTSPLKKRRRLTPAQQCSQDPNSNDPIMMIHR